MKTTYRNYQVRDINELNLLIDTLTFNQSIFKQFEMFGVTTVVIKTVHKVQSTVKNDIWKRCAYR